MAVHTPAKLNLFLDILGRRPDGFHELETVMVSVGLYDTLLFNEEATHQTRLRCLHATPRLSGNVPLSTGPDNLILRAAELIRERTGCDRGVGIDLWKRIPMQAGLGGGSSDAAATLVGLNRFWQLGLTSHELHTLAARLGSDVNFFLDSPLAAVCTGRGETITPLAVSQRLHFAVVCPHTGLSTAEVFRAWRQGATTSRSWTAAAEGLTSGRLHTRSNDLHNALEAPACELNADVAHTLNALRAAGASNVLMSGSGTACFGICRTARHARTIAGRLRQRRIGNVFAVDTRA